MKHILLAAFAVLAGTLSGHSQLVFNGSFERGVDLAYPSIQLDAPDSASIRHWAVTGGTIDYIGTRWPAGRGDRCLDLSGVSAGTISQQINGFQAGRIYQLWFLLSGNPEDGPVIKRVKVSIGNRSHEFSYDSSRSTVDNLRWRAKRLLFRATAPSMNLQFESLEGGWAGAALDAVYIR